MLYHEAFMSYMPVLVDSLCSNTQGLLKSPSMPCWSSICKGNTSTSHMSLAGLINESDTAFAYTILQHAHAAL